MMKKSLKPTTLQPPSWRKGLLSPTTMSSVKVTWIGSSDTKLSVRMPHLRGPWCLAIFLFGIWISEGKTLPLKCRILKLLKVLKIKSEDRWRQQQGPTPNQGGMGCLVSGPCWKSSSTLSSWVRWFILRVMWWGCCCCYVYVVLLSRQQTWFL